MQILWGLTQEAATRADGVGLLEGELRHDGQAALGRADGVRAVHARVSFCDEPHQRDMEAFFKDRSPKLPGGPRMLAQATEEIELCRAYVAAQQPSVDAFLKKY